MTAAPAAEGALLVQASSAERMRAIAGALGRAALPGDLFLLNGQLGAGKTTFVQGLAEGLGVTGEVTSPSFVLENQYRGRLRLYHVDLYRLERLDAAFIGELAEDLYGDGVAAVEWPDLLPPDLREGAVHIHFAVGEEEGSRRLTFTHLRLAQRDALARFCA